MQSSINFNKVADIYDFYVKVDFDIPFFLEETRHFDGEILELMCGTGRVSMHLLEAGKKMTCIDYSQGMLDAFRKKIREKPYKVTLLQQDVTQLNIDKKFGMAILPFHSISEILSAEKQRAALKSIAKHLDTNASLIITLQNPKKRLLTTDGQTRIIGKFCLENNKQMILSYMNQYNESSKTVSGMQFYEIYDESNILIEKRFLEINFRPIYHSEFSNLLKDTHLHIDKIYGDYSYNEFNEETSDFIIYKLIKTN